MREASPHRTTAPESAPPHEQQTAGGMPAGDAQRLAVKRYVWTALTGEFLGKEDLVGFPLQFRKVGA
jgi:hypothetical protein